MLENIHEVKLLQPVTEYVESRHSDIGQSWQCAAYV